MNIIEQLITDVKKHERSLEERETELKDELVKTRKMHKEVVRHRERLERDHPNGEAMLPLALPDDEEEEAEDEAPEVEAPVEAEPLVPDEWSPDYEAPAEPAEPTEEAAKSRLEDQAEADADKRPRRRRKAAVSEE